MASVLSAGQLIAVVAEGRARRAATLSRFGTRVPFSAPFGATFAAYGDEAMRAKWIRQRRGSRLSDEGAHQLEQVLSMVRERGYSVGRRQTRDRLGQVLWTLADDPGNVALQSEKEHLFDELFDAFVLENVDPAQGGDVANVIVPVFSTAGEVIMTVTGDGFADPLDGTRVVEIGARLRASADMVATRALGEAPHPRLNPQAPRTCQSRLSNQIRKVRS